MLCTDAAPTAVEETRVPLEQLDDTTLRAMCDGGWLDHGAYVALARARGTLIAEVSPSSGAPSATRRESGYVVMLPAEAGAPALLAALAPLSGRVIAALDYPVSGALTLPAPDTRMQHQRPRETPTISIA